MVLIDQLISAMKLILFQDSWSYLTVGNFVVAVISFACLGYHFLRGEVG